MQRAGLGVVVHQDEMKRAELRKNSWRLGRGTLRLVSTIAIVVCASGAAHAAQSDRPLTGREHQQYELQTSIAPGFTLAAVGDIINARPVSQVPAFAPVGKLIKNADVAFGNFEGTVVDSHNLPTWIEAETGGGAILMDPLVPPDLKKIGFDLVARANNHAMDLGVVGMKSTTEALEKAGLVQAGVGMSQGDARAPAFSIRLMGEWALYPLPPRLPIWRVQVRPYPASRLAPV